MWQYIDALSWSGWGGVLTAFLPISWPLMIVDVLLFVVLPLVVVFGLVAWHRMRFVAGIKGVWRSAGSVWSTCFWLVMLATVAIYFLSVEVMETSVCGATSFETQYRVCLSNGNATAVGERDAVERVRNGRHPSVKGIALYDAPEYKVVHFFWSNYRYIHPVLWVLLDLIVLGWFFFPGFKMKGQKIKL